MIAYKDPLGTVAPRIKAQIKHKDQKVSLREVRELEALLRKEGDIGLIVSSGGFTGEVEREIRASSKHIETMDLDRFIKLWQQYYDQIPEAGKTLMPLVKLYFLAWVTNHENIFVLGPTGVGQSFVACALARKACRDGCSALYTRAAALFRNLAIARADGSLRSLLTRLSRIDVLVIDDWAMAPMSEAERRDFWEICEDRYQTRSTILTSQLPVARWHEQIGDPTAADGILDRLVHNAHRIDMRGESMRKKRSTKPTD